MPIPVSDNRATTLRLEAYWCLAVFENIQRMKKMDRVEIDFTSTRDLLVWTYKFSSPSARRI